jgi:hypothetical protein
MMSSEWQFEHTGVSRVARATRRLAIWDGSWLELNGLSSEACVMLFPIERVAIQEPMSRASRPIV